MMNTEYVVFNFHGGLKFSDEESARVQAADMVKRYPGDRYAVYKLVAVYVPRIEVDQEVIVEVP